MTDASAGSKIFVGGLDRTVDEGACVRACDGCVCIRGMRDVADADARSRGARDDDDGGGGDARWMAGRGFAGFAGFVCGGCARDARERGGT